MRIIFIRHGKTEGNLTKKYIGRTDEPLCEAGINELRKNTYPDCDIVISSPMTRCLQTAKMIYPSKRILTYSELRECDFGDFEGKNHIDMRDDREYQKWLDKGGMAPFPNGEDSADFRKRCVNGFLKAANENKSFRTISFTVHGGTIMSVLEKLALPHKEFYEYMTENARGYITEYDGEAIRITEKI